MIHGPWGQRRHRRDFDTSNESKMRASSAECRMPVQIGSELPYFTLTPSELKNHNERTRNSINQSIRECNSEQSKAVSIISVQSQHEFTQQTLTWTNGNYRPCLITVNCWPLVVGRWCQNNPFRLSVPITYLYTYRFAQSRTQKQLTVICPSASDFLSFQIVLYLLKSYRIGLEFSIQS